MHIGFYHINIIILGNGWCNMLRKGSVREVIDACNEVDEVILFGAGRRIKKIEKMFSDTILLNKISAVLDNDEEKNGRAVLIAEKKVVIYHPNKIVISSQKKYLILITTAYFGEIISYLERSEKFKDIDTFVFSHIIAIEDDYRIKNMIVPDNLHFSDMQLIPKKIHYCWFGDNPIPDKYKAWMESWSKFCPDYEIIEWNENNYDITKNKYMYQAYRCKKWAFVPDYARFDIIYNEGGIYLDTDVELVKNLDDMLYQRGFAGFESEDKVAFGLGFGAMRQLPIIRELRDSYDEIEFLLPESTTSLVASPAIQTNFLEGKGLNANGTFQIIEGLSIYPEKVFCGKHMSSMKIVIDEETRSIHHYEGSWLDNNHKELVNKRYSDWKKYFE